MSAVSGANEIVVEEVPPAAARRAVGVLAAILGVLVFALVVAVGIPVVALTGGGAVAGVIVGLVGAVVGVAAGLAVTARERRQAASPAVTTFANDGITRVANGSRMVSPWSGVAGIFVASHRIARGSVVVIATDPPTTLVADNPRARKRSRIDTELYGGAVVLPVSELPVPLETLADRVAEWSGGACQVGSPPPRSSR